MPRTKLSFDNAIKELKERVENSIYTNIGELKIDAYCTKEPTTYENRMLGEKKEFKKGDSWGGLFDCAWFNLTGKVSSTAKGMDVVLLLDINGEACVFDKNGNPYRGLTTKSSMYDFSLGTPTKRVFEFKLNSDGNEDINLWMDCGANDLFGNLFNNGVICEAEIAIRNNNLLSLHYDIEVLSELADILPEKSARAAQIKEALYNAAVEIRKGTEEEAIKAKEILKPMLDKKNIDSPLSVSFIGHSHIDLAWLWPIRETFRKGARTFSTVMRNFEKYPDYKFVQSQAQIYDWMKKYYPALYEEIKVKIKEGRWEANGAMWVEPDCNMPCGESFVRQFFYAKRFFKDEFGVDSDVCFLPDTFGYSAALPQILNLSNVKYFTTQKISWNKVNKFPYHSFIWKGLDGSEVLSHMLPEENYNSPAMPRSFKGIEDNYAEKGVSEHALALFGIGDGGGGPGEEHIERLARQKSLLGQSDAVLETTSDFFKKLEKEKDKFNTWIGEMYLEFHQGTLTSQARNKKYNRYMEFALRNAEMISAWNTLYNKDSYKDEELETIWKEVLLYQFHDILPGSSIKRVYDESLERYGILFDETNSITDMAKNAIYNNVDTSDFKKPVILENTLSWERSEYIKVDNKWVKALVPEMGYTTVELEEANYNKPVISSNSLENEFVKVTFAENGNVSSILDKRIGKEVLKGDSNKFIIHEDLNDAWDMYPDYDLRLCEDVELVDSKFGLDGPCAYVIQTYKYNNSTITQKIKITDESVRVDFETEVDWKEDLKMLRVYFDVDVFTDYSRSEIQFGNVKRPNHTSTTWDMAKYEVCAHKWLDLSERGYGVAMLNDSKYGHRALGSVINLSLLRSTNYPGVDGDKAVHNFKYAIYPHIGDYVEGEVVREGFNFNVPIIATPVESKAGSVSSEFSYITCDSENVVIDTVKKAEDSDDIIVRLYECHETTEVATLRFGFNIKSAQIVNLLEEKIEDLNIIDNSIDVKTAPFKLISIRVSK